MDNFVTLVKALLYAVINERSKSATRQLFSTIFKVDDGDLTVLTLSGRFRALVNAGIIITVTDEPPSILNEELVGVYATYPPLANKRVLLSNCFDKNLMRSILRHIESKKSELAPVATTTVIGRLVNESSISLAPKPFDSQ